MSHIYTSNCPLTAPQCLTYSLASKGFAGDAKIVDEEGYEVRNPTPDPNQPRL